LQNGLAQIENHYLPCIFYLKITTTFLSAFLGPAGGLFLYSVFFPWATKKVSLLNRENVLLFI